MKAALTILIVLILCGPAVAQDLPPDILADQYLLGATKALENGDPRGALRAFGKIEALDTEPPPEFAYFYGKLLVENSTALDDLLKGQSLLKSYVISIEKDSEHYTPTLELLSVAGAKLEKAEAALRAEQRRRAEAERQERQRLAKLIPQLSANLSRQMVSIQGGSFTIGCTPEQGDDCEDSEKPAHRVQVSSFEISKYEVTQELWEAVMGKNSSYFGGCPECPVDWVSWNETQAFLTKLNDLTGERYRLPTEAEWEYAARGGQQSQGYKYAGSDNLGRVAWYYGNRGAGTHPIGQKQPNELGLYDMSGNVWEWVQDWYDDYPRGAVTDPQGPSSGTSRVRRGGSWRSAARYCRAADRDGYSPGYRSRGLGFRLARSP